jgi:hypothetical protein
MKQMKQQKDPKQIQTEFHALQSRQLIAIAITLFLVILAAVLYKRPDVLGEFSKNTLYGMQIATIACFLIYTIFNWNCPACHKGLGHDVHRRVCKKCGARLR